MCCMRCERFGCRYEDDLPQQGHTLDCALFLCGYATALLRQSPMDFEQSKMDQFREHMLSHLKSIGNCQWQYL